MKLLINICAHDGIMSHFAGVGTIVKRYIEATHLLLEKKNVEYEIRLFTPLYNEDSFGYCDLTLTENKKRDRTKVYIVSNGSNGKTAYGTRDNWYELSKNTAEIINKISFDDYDQVITIANDTPFAGMLELLKDSFNHTKIWIPHSTVKIHEVDSAIDNNSLTLFQERLKWEEDAIKYINIHDKCYLGSTGRYIEKHLIDEYNLSKEKSVYIPNGEIVSQKTFYIENDECIKLFEKIKNEDSLIVAFGRAEEYKNLDSTMYLGNLLGIKAVVITKPYFDGQPIIKKYKEIADETNSALFIDVPFHFPHYIINHFNKPIVLLIPSKKEIVGLIINEIRKMNKDNVLIVANDIGGLSEQINDEKDGVLVDLNNLEESANKIQKMFTIEKMIELNNCAQKRLVEDYNFEKIMDVFYKNILGDFYE